MVSKNATLLIKKSTTAGAVPSAPSLQTAELAINLVDRKLFSKDAGGTVFQAAPSMGQFDTPYANSKLANVSSGTIKGRASAGPGAPEDLTATQFQDMMTQASFDATAGGLRQWSDRIVIGNLALASMPVTSVSTQGLIVLGKDAAPIATDAGGGIVIGYDAMKYASILPYQVVAIGHRVMRDLQASSTSLSSQPGNRNTAIGALSSVFMTTGYQNTSVGRNSGGGVSSGYQNAAFGADALGGYGPSGLGGEIVNYAPITGFWNTALGYRAGKSLTEGTENTITGARAASALKRGSLNTVYGSGALISAEADNGINGNIIKSTTQRAATYAQGGGTAITITTATAHGAAVGDKVMLTFTSGPIFDSYTADPDIPCDVTAVSSSTVFQIQSEIAITASGNCTVNQVIGQVQGPVAEQNTAIGRSALSGLKSGNGHVAIGYNAGSSLESGANSVFIGRFAGTTNVDGSTNTAFGTNVTCLGQGARVSGNNQLQLGDAATTVYAQAAVQVRSDERDKADIRDTVLGLDWIMALRPRDYRYDMREDYLPPFRAPPTPPEIEKPQGLEMPGAEPGNHESDAHADWVARVAAHEKDAPIFAQRMAEFEAVVATYDADLATWQGEKSAHDAYWQEWYKNPEKDGSKKRSRFHHGLIAQEVKAAMEEQGIDFGGIQDHSLNGGKDVFSIRYEELIASLIKAVQQQQAMIAEMQEQLAHP
jgi:hypothetical protein